MSMIEPNEMDDKSDSTADGTLQKTVGDNGGVSQGIQNASANNSNTDPNANAAVAPSQPQPDTAAAQFSYFPADSQDVYEFDGLDEDMEDEGKLAYDEARGDDTMDVVDCGNSLQQIRGESRTSNAQDHSTTTSGQQSAANVNQAYAQSSMNDTQYNSTPTIGQIANNMTQAQANGQSSNYDAQDNSTSRQQSAASVTQAYAQWSMNDTQYNSAPTIGQIANNMTHAHNTDQSSDNSGMNQYGSTFSTVDALAQNPAGNTSQQQDPSTNPSNGVVQLPTSAAGTSNHAGTAVNGNPTTSCSNSQAEQKQATAQKRKAPSRRRGNELHETLTQARTWYSDLDHGDELALRKRKIPRNDPSQSKKAKRSNKTKASAKDDGASLATQNDDGASLATQNDNGASLATQNDDGASLATQNDNGASLATQNDDGAARQQ